MSIIHASRGEFVPCRMVHRSGRRIRCAGWHHGDGSPRAPRSSASRSTPSRTSCRSVPHLHFSRSSSPLYQLGNVGIFLSSLLMIFAGSAPRTVQRAARRFRQGPFRWPARSRQRDHGGLVRSERAEQRPGFRRTWPRCASLALGRPRAPDGQQGALRHAAEGVTQGDTEGTMEVRLRRTGGDRGRGDRR